MKRALSVTGVVVLWVALCAPAEITLRDGTVIHAASYQVRGSYVAVILPDGRQVAYLTSDVDLDALRAQAATVDQEDSPPSPPKGISAAVAPLNVRSSLTLTDSDVEHVDAVDRGATQRAAQLPIELDQSREDANLIRVGKRTYAEGEFWSPHRLPNEGQAAYHKRLDEQKRVYANSPEGRMEWIEGEIMRMDMELRGIQLSETLRAWDELRDRP